MWKRMNLMSGQGVVTKTALIVTFVLSIVSLAGLLAGAFQMWPVVATLTFHGVWVAIAYRKKVKISKTGVEFEEDEEGEGK